MSTSQTALDRKARRTLMLVGEVALLLLAVAVASHIDMVRERDAPSAPASADEGLVVIDGHRMILEPSELGHFMTAWGKSAREKTLIFELSDLSFVPNSPAPSPLGNTRIVQVVGETQANPLVTVQILVPTNAGSPTNRRLNEARASRLQEALLSRGVGASRVTISSETADLPTAKDRQIALLLAK